MTTEFQAGDPIELRRMLVEFGQRFSRSAPTGTLEVARSLLAELDDWGVPRERPAVEDPPAPPEPAAPDPAPTAPPVTLRIKSDGHGSVVARDPQSEPAARSLNKVLQLLAAKPVGSMASAIMEIAVHCEALEMENAALRHQLEFVDK